MFGDNIFCVIDRYQDSQAPELLVKGRQIFVGRKFLDKRGLPWFPRVGWQCGDFVYYAAAAVLPNYDFYFVVEEDVSFRFADRSFFDRILVLDFDIAMYGMGVASDQWEWTKSMAGYYGAGVHHAFFPVSCVSRNTADYLLAERVKYSRSFKNLDRNEVNFEYGNDEVFAATASVHAGLACRNIASLFSNSVWERFSLLWPLHPEEVGFFEESILHPVCSGPKARKRFDFLMRDFNENMPKLNQRFQEFSRHLGSERWEQFTGIEKRFFEEGDASPLVQLFSLQTSVANAVRGKTGLSCKTWVYERRIAVFDFEIADVTIAFDVSFSAKQMAYRIEIFGRHPSAKDRLAKLNGGETPKTKILVGAVSDDLDLSAKGEAISKIIADSLSAILD